MLSTGDVILVEDTTGPGHGTTVLEDAVVAVVRVSEGGAGVSKDRDRA